MLNFLKKEVDVIFQNDNVKHQARMVWQVLFNLYRHSGGDLNQMDAILCDYGILIRWLSNELSVEDKPVSTLYFNWDGSWTDLNWYPSSDNDFTIRKIQDGVKIVAPEGGTIGLQG